jgi:hypothetical protein
MNCLAAPKAFGTRYQELKMPVKGCHSALDAESRFSFFWIPAFAGMTIFSTLMQSFKAFFD